ncbi:uncharacterized protein E5676_scaffold45G00180 [Cucumis melo var. makuwa]|uniref:Uncharacterized protein n=1 Tax=Cucumis melo var. makuwa TaxID=1194695 RepID=A0A5D3CSS7_CUCMM|nr:uncharacterized protein E5676_scaffold45G00180 [Cucumis melo var. makuwa]
MTLLPSLVDDGLVGDRLREQPTIENDDSELFNLLNDLQGPMREEAYDEDEEDFENEMHENTKQRKFSEFASDPRNIRSALASDGFNPFANMRPKSPGKEISVYLQPLIEELKSCGMMVMEHQRLSMCLTYKEDRSSFKIREKSLSWVTDVTFHLTTVASEQAT